MTDSAVKEAIWQSAISVIAMDRYDIVEYGAGFCVGRDLVLTSAHLVADKFAVRLVHPFSRRGWNAHEHFINGHADLALIRLPRHPFAHFKSLKLLDAKNDHIGRVIMPDVNRPHPWPALIEAFRARCLRPAFRSGRIFNFDFRRAPYEEAAFELFAVRGDSGSLVACAKTAKIVSMLSTAAHDCRSTTITDNTTHTADLAFGNTPERIGRFLNHAVRDLGGCLTV